MEGESKQSLFLNHGVKPWAMGQGLRVNMSDLMGLACQGYLIYMEQNGPIIRRKGRS